MNWWTKNASRSQVNEKRRLEGSRSRSFLPFHARDGLSMLPALSTTSGVETSVSCPY
jgi:hypothetical protein